MKSEGSMNSISEKTNRARFSSSSLQEFLCPPRLSLLERVLLWSLSIFVFALPTNPHFGDISVTLPVGSLCVLLGVVGIMRRRTIVVLGFELWCLLAFVIWSTCSIAWAEYPASTTFKLTKYWEFLPMIWVIAQYAWDRHFRIRLFDAYVAGCWYGAIGTFFNYATGRVFYIEGVEEQWGRYSFGVDVNYLALALVIGMIIAWYRFSSDRTWWKYVFYPLYFPAAFVAIGLTGSRGGLVALLAAVVVFAICADRRTRVAVFVGAAVLVALTLVLPSSVTWRLSTTTDELNHGTLSGRRAVWDRGTAIVEEHPLVGLGVGGVVGAMASLDFNAAHNTPLELLVEEGIVGFAFFYGGLAYGVYRVWRFAGKEGKALVAVSAAWFVGTCSITWDSDLVTWFMFAMLLSAGSASRTIRVPNGLSSVLNAGARAFRTSSVVSASQRA